MKWFKHICTSYHDENLSLMTDELGMEGYGFWWRTLEVVAEKMDETDNYSCTFSAKKWGNFYGFSAKKFEKFARIFEKFGLLSVEILENSITISIPNLLKYKDEWSRRKAKNSRVTPKELPCKDKEEDKDIYTPQCTTYTTPQGVEAVEPVPAKKSKAKFEKPTVEEVAAYCAERGNDVDPEAFVAFYDSNGWRVGKNPMRDWKGAVRTWEQRRREEARTPPGNAPRATTVGQQRWLEEKQMAQMVLESKLRERKEREHARQIG